MSSTRRSWTAERNESRRAPPVDLPGGDGPLRGGRHLRREDVRVERGIAASLADRCRDLRGWKRRRIARLLVGARVALASLDARHGRGMQIPVAVSVQLGGVET